MKYVGIAPMMGTEYRVWRHDGKRECFDVVALALESDGTTVPVVLCEGQPIPITEISDDWKMV